MGSITCTTLSLLTRDGAVTVAIVPGLESDHYNELHEVVLKAETAEELRTAVKAACGLWGHEVTFG